MVNIPQLLILLVHLEPKVLELYAFGILQEKKVILFSVKIECKYNTLRIYITISTFTSVCPYGVGVRRQASSRPTSDFYHVQSSRSPVRPLLSEAKPSYVYSILKPHGQSSRSPVRPLLSEAKPSCVYSILKPHGKSSRGPGRQLPPRRSRGAYTQS